MKVKTCSPERAMSVAMKHMDGPFDRAHRDCWRTASAAFHELWGIDPMGPHSYRSLREARELISAGGGARAYCSGLAARAGLVEEKEASGLIGMVSAPGDLGWSGGLCIEPGIWAVKRGDGVGFVDGCIAAWGVPWD